MMRFENVFKNAISRSRNYEGKHQRNSIGAKNRHLKIKIVKSGKKLIIC